MVLFDGMIRDGKQIECNQVLSVEEEMKYSYSMNQGNKHVFHVFSRFHGVEDENEADFGNFLPPS